METKVYENNKDSGDKFKSRSSGLWRRVMLRFQRIMLLLPSPWRWR